MNPVLKAGPALLAVAVLLLGSCGGPGQLSKQPVAPLLLPPGVKDSGPQSPWDTFVPAFPPGWVDSQQSRSGSDLTVPLNGVDFTAESPVNANYVPTDPAGSYALIADGTQQLTWAGYSASGLAENWPVSLSITVQAAEPQGGGDPLPLRYFVGVSDYTIYGWDWSGPFDSDAEIPLNQAEPEIRDRYVDAIGDLQFVIVSGLEENDLPARPGVKVLGAAVIGSPTALSTKPHYPLLAGSHAASSMGKKDRRPSSLEPAQFVSIDWIHIAAIGLLDLGNEALSFSFSRRQVGIGEYMEVGQVAAQNESFVDPLDLFEDLPEPLAGTTHEYLITARNQAGSSASSYIRVTVPMIPPKNVQASVNQAGTDGVEISWDAAEDAVSYDIWRSGDNPPSGEILIASEITDLTVTDQTADPGLFYWYYVAARGQGDGDSGNGEEPGQVSDFSQGAQGLAEVLLAVECTTDGVSGTGNEADPYVLTAGQDYSFTARGQKGGDYTFLSDWTVVPGGAAEFEAGVPGHLINVQPGPSAFRVDAVYSFLEFDWMGSAWCTVP